MFYDDMTCYYSILFPVNNKAEFIRKIMNNNTPLLDVGCSDGAVALELAKSGYTIEAIDLNDTMIKHANKLNKYPFHLSYQVMNMLQMPYEQAHFKGIYCIGNTLVHLNPTEVDTFLAKSYDILKPGGLFIIQILNYAMILEKQLTELPPIENETIYFERQYHYRAKHIDFVTRLTDKKKGITFENSMPLYPLLPDQLIQKLKKLNFTHIIQYSSFSESPYTPNSLTAIVIGQKS